MIVARDYLIGRVSHEYTGYNRRARLTVDVNIREREGYFQTVDHGYTIGHRELAISAGVWNMNGSDMITAGQCLDALDNMVVYVPGWNQAKVQRLREIWKRWHLNGMHAGCVHQNAGLDCPEGYKYGSAWLAEPLPQEIEYEVVRMFA